MERHEGMAVGRGEPSSGGRDRSLDALRGFAILSVVLGHMLTKLVAPEHQSLTQIVVFVLYLYNVQLFAFVSGYLMKQFVLVRGVRTLLIPFLTGVVFGSAVLADDFFAGLPVQLVAGLGGTGMWFLWALFLSYCIFGLLRNRWLLLAVAVVTAATWQLIPTWTFEPPHQFADALGAFRSVGLVLPYMVFGAFWRRSEARGFKLTGVVAGLSLAVFSLVAVSLLMMQRFIEVSSVTGAVALSVTYWTIQAIGCCFGCVAALWMSRRLTGVTLGFFGFFGLISIGVYQFHPILIAEFLSFFSTRTLAELLAKTVVLVVVSAALTLLVGMNRLTSAAFLGGRSWPMSAWPGLVGSVVGERE